MRRPRALVVGGGAREHAIGAALARSEATVYVAAPTLNPGLKALAKDYLITPVDQAAKITAWAKERRLEVAILGPEAAIAAGVADALRAGGILTVGPSKAAGRIESSKAFARDLMKRRNVPGLPNFIAVSTPSQVAPAVTSLGGPFVVKPSGLTGGKGVWVQGVDFQTPEEGIAYATSLLAKGGEVVLEEKLEGEEFSLMAFVDGSSVYPMPAVQDYKRALEGHKGANTGGMGSFSERDHSLPFLRREDLRQATEILRMTVQALKAEGLDYRGVLYGGFMATATGPKVVEFNARFGDPEALNVLTLFDGTDFADLMMQVATGRVDPSHVSFRARATVVKYIVPPGYPTSPKAGGSVVLDREAITNLAVTVYYGSVTPGRAPNQVVMGSSRGLALVGEASAIKEAEARVEQALTFVKGDYAVRHDIGGAADVKAKVDHMKALTKTPPWDPSKNPTRSGPTPPPIFT